MSIQAQNRSSRSEHPRTMLSGMQSQLPLIMKEIAPVKAANAIASAPQSATSNVYSTPSDVLEILRNPGETSEYRWIGTLYFGRVIEVFGPHDMIDTETNKNNIATRVEAMLVETGFNREYGEMTFTPRKKSSTSTKPQVRLATKVRDGIAFETALKIKFRIRKQVNYSDAIRISMFLGNPDFLTMLYGEDKKLMNQYWGRQVEYLENRLVYDKPAKPPFGDESDTWRNFADQHFRAAISNDPMNLQFTPEEVRNNEGIVRYATRKSSGKAFKYASESLRNDPEFVEIAMRSLQERITAQLLVFENAGPIPQNNLDTVFHAICHIWWTGQLDKLFKLVSNEILNQILAPDTALLEYWKPWQKEEIQKLAREELQSRQSAASKQ